jgi:hypothetical protein
MALQLRRGLDGAARTAFTPGVGEIIYTTDTKKVYIGDGTTAGGNPVSLVSSVNTQTGAVVLTADNIAEASGSPTNLYFTTERAQDSVAAAFIAGNAYNTNITFTYDDANNRITASVPSSSSVINTGYANSLAVYSTNGTTLSPSSSIQWNETSNLLQNVNGTVQITANNYGRATMLCDNFHASSTVSNAFTMQRARGTNISPVVVNAGDTIHSLTWQAFDGTQMTSAAAIVGVLTSGTTISTGIVPGTLSFQTMAQTGAFESRMRITDAGITLGPNTNTDTGSSRLAVRQAATSNGTATIQARNYYSDTYGAELGLTKYRGTYSTTAPVQTNDVLGQVTGQGSTVAGTGGNGSPASAAQIQFTADGTVSSGIVPGAIKLNVANNSGVMGNVVKINNTTTGSTSALVAITGNLSLSGLEIVSPNYVSVGTTGTYVLSTISTTNILLVGTTGLTATLTFPSAPTDGQVLRFAVHTNTVTLALTAGPTLSGTFAGSITAPTTFTYIYRATGTTWYRVQ